jgi:hypothetical protein
VPDFDSIIWREGDPDDEVIWSTDFSATPCSESLRSTELILRVLPAAPSGLRPAVHGMAPPDIDGKILGYAIAHEIGHVLAAIERTHHGRCYECHLGR